MSLLDYFKPVSSWSPARVREYLENHLPETYNLVDVRRPSEYEEGHLPGARLIPVDELEDRLGELDPDLPTIAYCAAGVRSRAAAAALQNAGFREVYSMAGGFRAWEGRSAEGTPEQELAFFSSFSQPEKQAAFAWKLEEGTRTFYSELAARVQDPELSALFRELVEAEEHHKATLVALYEALAGKPAEADFPRGVVETGERDQLMEGGMAVPKALEWIRGRQARDILELAIALETNAYDRYLTLRRELEDENSRRVFEVLSDEERRHLKKLTGIFEHFL